RGPDRQRRAVEIDQAQRQDGQRGGCQRPVEVGAEAAQNRGGGKRQSPGSPGSSSPAVSPAVSPALSAAVSAALEAGSARAGAGGAGMNATWAGRSAGAILSK